MSRRNKIYRELLLVLSLFCSEQNEAESVCMFTDSDWSNHGYQETFQVDTENYQGAVLLRNEPSRMVLAGIPTTLPLVTDMQTYKDELLFLACTDPMAISNAEFYAYDPVHNTTREIAYYNKKEGISSIFAEQGTHIMRRYDDKIYFAGYDPDNGPNGKVYIYDGATFIRKTPVPRVVHGRDAPFIKAISTPHLSPREAISPPTWTVQMMVVIPGNRCRSLLASLT